MPLPCVARAALWLGVVSVVASCGPPREPTTAPTPREDSAAQVETTENDAVCRPVAFPDTRAGHRLEHLHRAITAADASLVDRFVDEEMSAEFLVATARARHIQVLRSLHDDEGRTLLCRIESSQDDEVVAILGGLDDNGDVQYGRFFLKIGGEEGKVASLGIEAAAREDVTRPLESLDADAVRKVVDDVATGLADYVYADKAEAMQTKIRGAADAGEYASMAKPRTLAKRLTRELFEVAGDKHLRVVYSASDLPPKPERDRSPEEIEKFRKHAAGDNFGMPVAEVRGGSIGYLLVLGFLPPEVAADAVAETMSKLADADVLIIDLRQNGGGSPHGVALMTSYLFDSKPVHLNDIYNRSKNSTESFHTSPNVPGRKFGPKKPIFVLTSARTFSAGEEFAYNLKARKRATIVGETTGGGAHPTEFIRVSNHWAIALPNARAINPLTKTNWEGTGVTPDVEVAAADALEKALELAEEGRR